MTYSDRRTHRQSLLEDASRIKNMKIRAEKRYDKKCGMWHFVNYASEWVSQSLTHTTALVPLETHTQYPQKEAHAPTESKPLSQKCTRVHATEKTYWDNTIIRWYADYPYSLWLKRNQAKQKCTRQGSWMRIYEKICVTNFTEKACPKPDLYTLKVRVFRSPPVKSSKKIRDLGNKPSVQVSSSPMDRGDEKEHFKPLSRG